ncbi:uncharacterized protein VTP21DRAFT_4949 [Calcarisporiella thermophila]|uniref:uncharacterized protein n=1 Tax=Calcarisporiella thermophila TaxID=911321 RepID=UPI0037447441
MYRFMCRVTFGVGRSTNPIRGMRLLSFVQPCTQSSNVLSGIRKISTKASGKSERKQRLYGQPVPETHPHMMKRGEITPGIPAIEYELRRSKLMSLLPENSVVISLGYRTRYMSNNVFYPFHQNTDFWYLCGFNEPDSALVLEKNSSSRGYKMILFVPPRHRDIEMWEGARTGIDGAIEKFGADEAYDTASFNRYIEEQLSRDTTRQLFLDIPPAEPSILSLETLATPHRAVSTAHDKSIRPLSPLIQELRLIKSRTESVLMRQAGEITAKAFIEGMRFTRPGMTEHQLHAKLDFECRVRGAQMLAYVPVVASGQNALTIHYVTNDMVMKDGDLVLVDAGGEYNGYVSDVTRTWPINGRFSDPQREIYQAVLNVQKQCIKLCTEKQNISLNGIHAQSERMLGEELSKLGIRVPERDLSTRLYPHHIGHYLGLDVHDTHDIDRVRRLREGMVVTIEPGLYIPFDDAYPKKYQGIGVRIEDNVLVGKEDPIILSVTAPKEVVDIEFCCQSGRE